MEKQKEVNIDKNTGRRVLNEDFIYRLTDIRSIYSEREIDEDDIQDITRYPKIKFVELSNDSTKAYKEYSKAVALGRLKTLDLEGYTVEYDESNSTVYVVALGFCVYEDGAYREATEADMQNALMDSNRIELYDC